MNEMTPFSGDIVKITQFKNQILKTFRWHISQTCTYIVSRGEEHVRVRNYKCIGEICARLF